VKAGLEADRVLVQHMQSCIAAIEEFLDGDPQRFLTSRLVRDATLRNLQTLTESSQRVSPQTQLLSPEIPWRKLAGFRNILVHDYLGGIDEQAVFLILRNDFSVLKAQIHGLADQLLHIS
jgi:uncharacterized protein with HEPN domain